MGIQNNAGNVRPVVSILLERADQFVANGEIEHACSFYRAAIAADQTAIARIAYGAFLADAEREVAARKQLEEAWDTAKLLNDSASCALACHNLASLYRRQGQAVIAESYQQQALRAWMDQGPEKPIPAWLISGRAHDLIERDSVNADRLWRIAQSEKEEASTALMNRAVMAHRNAQDQQARNMLREAFAVAEERRELAACAAILQNLAELEMQSGRWTIADECLKVAEQIEIQASRQRSVHQIREMRNALKRGLAMLATDPSWN